MVPVGFHNRLRLSGQAAQLCGIGTVKTGFELRRHAAALGKKLADTFHRQHLAVHEPLGFLNHGAGVGVPLHLHEKL